MTTSMPMANSSGGGNIFGQQTSTAEDLRTSAWTEINKAALGITSDSIDQVFTQLSPRYNSGYLGGFGYKASQDQPLLDHPLESIRRLLKFYDLPQDNWKLSYDELVKQLPPDLLSRFQQEVRQPLDERNSAFVALDNVLVAAAKLLTGAASLSQPDPIDSLPAMRTSLNLLLPFVALKNTFNQGSEIAESAQNLLQELGPNNRHFDGLHALLGEVQSGLNAIKEFDTSFGKKNYAGELSSDAKNALADLAKRLDILHNQQQSVSLGEDLQILSPLLKSMSVVTAALSLPYTESAGLFLGLHTASIGLGNDNAAGVLGDSLQTIRESAVSGILSALMPNANFGEQQMLDKGIAASFPLLIALAARSTEGGIGTFPLSDNTSETKSAQFFAFELALLFANSSSSLNDTFKILVETSGGDEKAQAAAGPILGQLAAMLMILAATREGNQHVAHLIESQRKYLEEGVAAAKDAQEKDEEIQADNQRAAITAMAVKQSQIALEEKDYEAFIEAYSTLIESLDSSLDNLLHDIDTIRDASSHASSQLADFESDQPLTDVHHVV